MQRRVPALTQAAFASCQVEGGWHPPPELPPSKSCGRNEAPQTAGASGESIRQPRSPHRSAEFAENGCGGGVGGGEGGGEGGGGDGGGGEGGGDGGGGDGGGGEGGGDGGGDGGGGDGGGGAGGGDGGGGDGGGGDGGGDGGGGEGGGDGGRPDTSSAQQRTARSAAVASQLYTALSSPRCDTRYAPAPPSACWHSSHTHTSASSCPQPLPRAAGSSSRVHSLAP